MRPMSDFEFLGLPNFGEVPQIICQVKRKSALLRQKMVRRLIEAADQNGWYLSETSLVGLYGELSFSSLFSRPKVVICNVDGTSRTASTKKSALPVVVRAQAPIFGSPMAKKQIELTVEQARTKRRPKSSQVTNILELIGGAAGQLPGYLIFIDEENSACSSSAWRTAVDASTLIVEPMITKDNISSFIDFWIGTGALGPVARSEYDFCLQSVGERLEGEELLPVIAVKEIERAILVGLVGKERADKKREWSSLKETIRDLMDSQGEKERHALVRAVDRLRWHKLRSSEEIVAQLFRSTAAMLSASDKRYRDYGLPPTPERVAWGLLLLARERSLLNENIVVALDRLCNEFMDIGDYAAALGTGAQWQAFFGGARHERRASKLGMVREDLIKMLAMQVARVVDANNAVIWPEVLLELDELSGVTS